MNQNADNSLATRAVIAPGLPALVTEERKQTIVVPDRGSMAVVVKTLSVPADGWDMIVPPKYASGDYPARAGSRQPKSDTYSILAKIVGMSFRQVGNLDIERNRYGKIQSVTATMQCQYLSPTGDVIVDEETMFLDMDDFVNEERKKRCMRYNKATRRNEIIEDRVRVVRDTDGNVEDVVYILPDGEEVELHAACERRRTMLPRILLTKLHNRLTRRATGVGARSVEPGQEMQPERVVITAVVASSDTYKGDAADLYGDPAPCPAIAPSAEPTPAPPPSQKPSERRAAEQEPQQPESQGDAPDVDPNDRTRCHDCSKTLSDKDFNYFQANPSYTPRCYKCNQARRARG